MESPRRKGESFQARTYRRIFCTIMPIAAVIAIAVHHSRGGRLHTETYLKGEAIVEEIVGFSDMLGMTTSSSTAATTVQEDRRAAQQDFRDVADQTGTDKVMGYKTLPRCLGDNSECLHGGAERPSCRSWGHFYDTIYNRWLGEYSTPDAKPIQFLEIGYFQGKGFEAFSNFLPTAEKHSMEISCIEPGPRAEGKWPWGNFAEKHRWYEDLRSSNRLHCGDASDYNFLKEKWDTYMNRPDAPPLMAVVDDGAHLHDQMAATLFFWFPRIQPGGILVVEDVQPHSEANRFRTHIVPQVMKDLHWCGGTGSHTVSNDPLCFPTIQPLLEGVHCEMHICVFVRNNEPAYEPDEATSRTPPEAFMGAQKCLFGPHD